MELRSAVIEIPDSPSLRPAALTVEAWVRFDSLASLANRVHDDHYIVSREFLRDNGLYAPSFVLGKQRSDVQRGDNIFFDIGSSTGSARIVETNLLPVVTNRWYHIVGTYDGTTMKLYRNGALTYSMVFPVSLLGPGLVHYDNTPLRIGKVVRDFDEGRFQGVIDEAAIYDRALSDAEIRGIYNAGVSGKCVGTEPVFLAARQNGSSFTLSWPATLNIRLETATSFAPPVQWTPAPNATSVVGDQKVVTITPAGVTRFFRLAPVP